MLHAGGQGGASLQEQTLKQNDVMSRAYMKSMYQKNFPAQVRKTVDCLEQHLIIVMLAYTGAARETCADADNVAEVGIPNSGTETKSLPASKVKCTIK